MKPAGEKRWGVVRHNMLGIWAVAPVEASPQQKPAGRPALSYRQSPFPCVRMVRAWGGVPAIPAIGWRRSMIPISITADAYEAIKASLSELDNPAPSPGPDGLIKVRLDRTTFDRLGRLSRPGESHSDVILRMAAGS
jgi:hypothetical protein